MIKNIINLFISNLLFGLTQLFIIIVLNKFSPLETVGWYTLSLAIVGPLTVFTNMSLHIHINTSKKEEDFINYLILRIFSSSLMIILSFMFTSLVKDSAKIYIFILLVASVKFIESIFDINYAFYQKNRKHNLVAISKSLRSILLILWMIICVLLFHANFVILFLGIIILNIVVFYIYDYKKIRKNIDIRLINIIAMGNIILSSLPLVISSTIDSLNINIQRIFIQNMLNINELGIYASLTTFMVSGQVLVAAVMTYFLPILNDSVKNKNKLLFTKIMLITSIFSLFIGFFLTVVMYFSGKKILPLLFNDNYADYVILTTLIMTAGAFWYLASALNYCILALNLYKNQMVSIILSFLLMLLLSIIFIDRYGINGAACALVFSLAARATMFGITILKKVRSL